MYGYVHKLYLENKEHYLCKVDKTGDLQPHTDSGASHFEHVALPPNKGAQSNHNCVNPRLYSSPFRALISKFSSSESKEELPRIVNELPVHHVHHARRLGTATSLGSFSNKG